MARLIDAARSVQPDCKVTLHRAFDVCRGRFAALEDARALGVDTILTSGQAASCAQGRSSCVSWCAALMGWRSWWARA